LRVTPSLSTDFGHSEVAFSPGIALVGHPSEGWRLWGRAGQAYRLPTFADLFLGSSYQTRPNPDLRPERVRLDAEVGVEWNARTLRARTHIGAFFRQTVDPIIWLPSSTAVWSPRNAGRLDALGVEGAGELSPGAGWRLSFAATWTRSQVRFGADRTALPYQPAWSGRLALRRSAGTREATFGLRYTGSRNTSLAAPHALPPYAVLDLAGRQTIRTHGPDLEIEIGIRNLLNARYELVELFPEPGRQFVLRFGVRTRPASGLPPVARSGKMNGEESRPRGTGPEPAGSAGPPDGNRTEPPPS
jgi:iron complex outermembrane receptor protein